MTGEAAKRVVGAEHALHGKAKRRLARIYRRRQRLKQFEQGGPLVPCHGLRAVNDVVAGERADGHKRSLHRVARISRNLLEKLAEVRFNGLECGLVVADQVHFVDRYDDRSHAKQ